MDKYRKTSGNNSIIHFPYAKEIEPELEWIKNGSGSVDRRSRRLVHRRPWAPADPLGHHEDESGSASLDGEE
jgi:hypothetical protein